MNNCKYKKIRTKKGIKYGYCSLLNVEVELFNCKCNKQEMKHFNTLWNNNTKPKKTSHKSPKIAKLERNRYSILTDNLDMCIECGMPKDNLHEIYEGAYRGRSMQYGLVIPLCVKHHRLIHKDYNFKIKYKELGEVAFKNHYPNLEFNKLFYYKRKD